MSSQYGKLRPLVAEIGLGVCGTPANFKGFRILPSLLQRRHSSDANQTLHDVWPSPGLVHYIYIFGGSRIWPGAKLTLCSSLAFSYIGSVTASHSSSRRQPNFARGTRNGITEVSQRAPTIFGWAAITLGISPHSSFTLKKQKLQVTVFCAICITTQTAWPGNATAVDKKILNVAQILQQNI